MSRTARGNNIVAGFFVIAGMLMTVALAFWVGDGSALIAKRDAYVVRFSIADGVTGVDNGSPVTLGGNPVGRVSGIRLVDDEVQPGVPRYIDVTIEINQRVRLYANARPMVVTPLLGTLATINIPDPGGPNPGNADVVVAEPGDRFVGSTAPALLAQAGFDAEEIKTIVTDISRITSAFAPEAEPAAQDIRAMIATLRKVAERVDTKSAEYAGTVETILDDVTKLTTRFESIGERADMIAEDSRVFVSELRQIAGTTQDLLDTNKDRINTVVANAEAFAERLRTTITPTVEDMLGKGRDAMGEAKRLGERVNFLVDTEAPGLRRTLGNVRLMSDQASIFFEELKAAPWRVLVRPGSKEIAEETLYDAARQYATAVSRLRAASASMESAIEGLDGRGGSPDATAASLTNMRGELEAAFDQYRKTEASLLDMFNGRAGSGKQ